MDAFAWLDTFLEANESGGDTTHSFSEFEDVFGEAFDPKAIGASIANAGKKVSALIDKIISEIKALAEKFRLKYAQIHFQASLKKIGKNCAKQIKASNVPREYLVVIKQALAIEQRTTKKVYELWMKAETGKITFDQYDSQLQVILKNDIAACDAISLKVDKALNMMSAGALVNTTAILGQYDKAVTSLLDAQATSTKYTVSQLGKLKKNKSGSEAISNKAAKVIQRIHTVITQIINKITATVASLGDKILRRAASGESAEDTGSKKKGVKNEEADETLDSDLDDFLESFIGEEIGGGDMDFDMESFLEGFDEAVGNTDDEFDMDKFLEGMEESGEGDEEDFNMDEFLEGLEDETGEFDMDAFLEGLDETGNEDDDFDFVSFMEGTD